MPHPASLLSKWHLSMGHWSESVGRVLSSVTFHRRHRSGRNPPSTFSFHLPSNSFGRTSVMKARVYDPSGSKQIFSPPFPMQPLPKATCQNSRHGQLAVRPSWNFSIQFVVDGQRQRNVCIRRNPKQRAPSPPTAIKPRPKRRCISRVPVLADLNR